MSSLVLRQGVAEIFRTRTTHCTVGTIAYGRSITKPLNNSRARATVSLAYETLVRSADQTKSYTLTHSLSRLAHKKRGRCASKHASPSPSDSVLTSHSSCTRQISINQNAKCTRGRCQKFSQSSLSRFNDQLFKLGNTVLPQSILTKY